MTQLRVAWRRAVGPGTDGDGPGLSDLLAFLGPAVAASDWTCDGAEANGPLADELRHDARAGLIREATRPGDDGPWLAVQVADGGQFVVATRSRALLDDLRQRFRDDEEFRAPALRED